MGLDELKDKYRAFPIWARLMMALIIGIAPGACSYFDEVESVEAGLTEAQNREEAARMKFEADRKTKANIPKLEEELDFTEGQLEVAAKRLPESYLIETILSLTATNAKQAGIYLTSFKPSCELKGEAEFKYIEREIAVTATGKFQQIAGFFDKMVHSDVMLFIRGIVIEPRPATAIAGPEITPFQAAENARRDLTLNATFKVVVFRAMKDEEAEVFENKENCDAVPADELTPPPEAINTPPTDAAPTPAPVEPPA